MRSILAVGGDAGGASALAPLLRALRDDPTYRLRVLGYGQAVRAWTREGVSVEVLPDASEADMSAWMGPDPIDFLLLSTSVNGVDHERALLRCAKERGVPSLAVLDFWSNYSLRFMDRSSGGLLLPSVIAVMDERVREEMIAEGFPSASLVVTGQPAFDEISRRRESWTVRRRTELRSALGMGTSGRLVLFVSQPLSAMATLGAWTSTNDERDILRAVVSALDNVSEADDLEISVAVRPHPRETLRPEDLPPGARCRVLLAREGEGWEAALAADLVVGITSILLVEAALLGCLVVSVQPDGDRERDPLPTNRSGASTAVYDLGSLFETLRGQLADGHDGIATETRSIFVDSDATRRILELIDRMTGSREVRG